MEIVIILSLFAGVTAAIAAGKNRNPLGWFAIGFLFPLLGIILASVLPPNPTPLDAPNL